METIDLKPGQAVKVRAVESKKQPMKCVYPGCKFNGEGGVFPLCKDKGTLMHRDWYYEWLKKLAGTQDMAIINEEFQGAKRDNLSIRALAKAFEGRLK